MPTKTVIKDFTAALERLQEALSVPATNDLIRAGCIQYFEFCFELAWKSIKVFGVEQGLEVTVLLRRTLIPRFSAVLSFKPITNAPYGSNAFWF